MKKLFLTTFLALGIGFASAQATHPAKAAPVKVQTTKTTAKPTAGKPVMHTKADGTPDKRYKENKHLKADGTKDRRFKENK